MVQGALVVALKLFCRSANELRARAARATNRVRASARPLRDQVGLKVCASVQPRASVLDQSDARASSHPSADSERAVGASGASRSPCRRRAKPDARALRSLQSWRATLQPI